MSLLLDALNKADQERKRNETTPGISSNHERRTGEEPRSFSLLLIVAGAIGLCVLFVVIYWLGQHSTATPPAQSNINNSATVVATENNKAATENKPAPVAEQPQAVSSNPPPNNADENVANLYQQNTQVPPANAAITLSTPQPAPAQQEPVQQEPVQPAPEPPPPPPPPATPENIPAPTSITQFANLPELHDLPNNILEKVPTLNYSEHNYNVNGGSVKINGAIRHVNEQIANGIVIDKILEDGMVLHIDNYSFKMRAMNSWVNM